MQFAGVETDGEESERTDQHYVYYYYCYYYYYYYHHHHHHHHRGIRKFTSLKVLRDCPLAPLVKEGW